MRLGETLRDQALTHAALFHDPTTNAELAACLEVVFEALMRSSLEPQARLAWALEALLRDPTDLCAGGYGVLEEPYGPQAWGAAADGLLARLDARPRPAQPGNDAGARERLVALAAIALERAARGDEALGVCVREARERRYYTPLLARLPGADARLLAGEVRGPGRHDELVAELLLNDAPAQAAALWQELAEAWIAGRGYGEAARTLRRLRQAMEAAGQAPEWRAYIEELRAAGGRRPRLVATLDALLGEE